MTKIAGSGSGSISPKHGSEDPDPDPPQNVMNPQHCFEDWCKCTYTKSNKQNKLQNLPQHFCSLFQHNMMKCEGIYYSVTPLNKGPIYSICKGLMRYKYIRVILTDQAEILPGLGEVLLDGETALDLPLCGNLQLSNVARLLHSVIPPRLSINQS